MHGRGFDSAPPSRGPIADAFLARNGEAINPLFSGFQNKDKETAENRDFNSDTDKNRYPASHPDNKKHRGNIDAGKS